MNGEELKELFDLDNTFEGNDISDEELHSFDNFILENIDKLSNEETFNVYKKFVPMKQQAPESMKSVLFSTIRNYANDEFSKEHYIGSLILYRFLTVKSLLEAQDYLNITKALYYAGDKNTFNKFANLYLIKEENKLLSYLELADFYKQIRNYKSAIRLYEKFLETDKTKTSIYTITADLYDKEYGIDSLENQIRLYEKAYTLSPENRLVLHGLAFCYEKNNNIQKADFFYKELLKNNPSENDYYNYGSFLISCGDFQNGHVYFTHRFNIDDKNFKYPSDNDKRWDLKSDISDKVLLIHYEQGFGDTIMYSRFVPLMKKVARKIIFVVQKELKDLIAGSEIFKGVEIITDEDKCNYDINMALLDTPLVLNSDANDLPYKDCYLDITEYETLDYRIKNFKDDNTFKIGLCTYGDSSANYTSRDIDLAKFNVLKDLRDIQLYDFKKDNIRKVEGIIPLGETFKDFKTTAAALKNMDLVISTDNVILNLAGAMGVKTIGLFNYYTNYRWFKTEGNNTGWYNSVYPIKAKQYNDWDSVIFQVINTIKNRK